MQTSRRPSTKRRKDTSDQGDARWRKRYTWSPEAHRAFVSAVFDVGTKSSTPSAILGFMKNRGEAAEGEKEGGHFGRPYGCFQLT